MFTFADMENKQIPELTFLLSEVEKKYGRRIATSTDFESLSIVMEHEIGEFLSCSTLKRIWGYMSLKPTPRRSTLDILSRYAGHRDFSSFREFLKSSDAFQSQFVYVRTVDPSDLADGAEMLIGWNPNRLVRIRHLGGRNFEVMESENSKLLAGDRFELGTIVTGYPLYIPRILRNGEYTQAYVAGCTSGLTKIEVL